MADKSHPASDVDMNIPINKTNNENTFAVIIANEDYTRVASVPMAENDGRIITEYCQKVLGLPKNNVRTYYNATALVMRATSTSSSTTQAMAYPTRRPKTLFCCPSMPTDRVPSAVFR